MLFCACHLAGGHKGQRWGGGCNRLKKVLKTLMAYDGFFWLEFQGYRAIINLSGPST